MYADIARWLMRFKRCHKRYADIARWLMRFKRGRCGDLHVQTTSGRGTPEPEREVATAIQALRWTGKRFR